MNNLQLAQLSFIHAVVFAFFGLLSSQASGEPNPNGWTTAAPRDEIRPEYPICERTLGDGWTEIFETYRVPAKATRLVFATIRSRNQ
jgi:hypothetical protein